MSGPPKKRTTISISPDVLDAVRREARRQDRSVSYVIEKTVEQKVKELPDGTVEIMTKKISYREPRRRRKK